MEAVKIPSRAELVQRVTDIVPVLRANAQWGDQHRRLADETVEAMIGAGVLRMLVPTQYGGYESDMQTIVDVGIQLGRGDGSPAFCATAWWAQCWAVAHFPDSVQDEIFADPDVRICGTLVPNGRGEITKDGVVVSGNLRVYGFVVYNTKASAQYLNVFDASELPADNAVPAFSWALAANSGVQLNFTSAGRHFPVGLVLCNSSTDTKKTLGAADCLFDVQYDVMRV